MNIIRRKFIWSRLLLIAAFLIGCSAGTTPPGANSIYGSVGETLYTYHYWEEGLDILIWHDFSFGGEGCSGSGSTEDPIYRLECNVEDFNGRNFEWKVHTSDGVTADIWIDDKPFDLSQGNLFLVTTENDQLQVTQLQRDFSELELSNESIAALANNDQDITNFLEYVALQNESTTETYSPFKDDDPNDGLVELLNALRFAGHTVEVTDRLDQPFFSIPAQIIVVNGEDVQVFEYPDSATTVAEASLISPDAGSVGTSMMSWVATPHFYSKDRLIVLYVGGNEAITNVLFDLLGEPVAEGQGGMLSPEIGLNPTSSGSGLTTSALKHPLAGLIYREGHEIWIIDENGESVFVIDEPSARLSADGRYALFQPEYDPDIWLADLITGERRNLTVSSNRYNGLPQWWPGQPELIIFGSSDDLGPGFGYPTTVRTDGSDYQVLDWVRGGPLALSADGEMLAYGGFDESGRIVDRGSEPEDFHPSDYGLDVEKVFQPAWSYDGRKIAWKVSGDLEIHGWTSGVAVFDLEAKSAILFHTYNAVGGGSVPHYLSWSPNGDWLAFVTFNERAEDGRRPNLWIARPDGQGEIRLGVAFEAVWSPEGNQIAYSLFDELQEAFSVWTHNIVTGEQEQILPAGTAPVDWLVPTDVLLETIRQY